MGKEKPGPRSETGSGASQRQKDHPIAMLSEFKPDRHKIAQPGSMEGEAWVAEDFNATLDDLFDAFEETA